MSKLKGDGMKMPKYIDAEKAPDLFDEKFKETLELIRNGEKHLDNLAEGFTEAHQVLFSMPPADVQEVKHARWADGICTNCGTKEPIVRVVRRDSELLYQYQGELNYCPNCGAKMEE